MNKPTQIIETRYGRLFVCPTSANHVYATTNPEGGKIAALLPWTLRGKEHVYITLHLYRHKDGKFHVGGEEPGDRKGFYCESASASARAVIIKEAERVVNALPAALFDQAEAIDLAEQIERAREQRAEMEQAVQALNVELARLRTALHTLTGAPITEDK